eukprot:COSAG05_NODE_716_length_7804_cov_2.669825_4_plen_58_part_00
MVAPVVARLGLTGFRFSNASSAFRRPCSSALSVPPPPPSYQPASASAPPPPLEDQAL